MRDVTVSFRIAGKRVQLEQIGDLSLRAVLSNAATDVRTRVAALKCPNHEGSLLIEIHGQSPERLNYSVQTCCQEFSALVRQTIE